MYHNFVKSRESNRGPGRPSFGPLTQVVMTSEGISSFSYGEETYYFYFRNMKLNLPG